jgi:hypothetical protein
MFRRIIQKILSNVAEPHYTMRFWLQFRLRAIFRGFRYSSGSMTSKNSEKILKRAQKYVKKSSKTYRKTY